VEAAKNSTSIDQQDMGCAVSLLALTIEYPALVFRVNTRGRSTTLQYSSTELKSPRGSDEGANGPSDGGRDGGRVRARAVCSLLRQLNKRA